ncbi:MAG: BamA/TamA family outer membrane protein [Candidatus Eisenbacteria bacterium]|nr:BamA/TamA family outer membrane protein [Candidatus Eisenbacteria bacterium]
MSFSNAVSFLLVAIMVAAPAASADEDSDAFIEVKGSDFIDWCDDTLCLMPAMDFYYTRVDGINYSIGIQYLNDRTLHPRVSAIRGWMSAREEGSYRVDFEQPILSRDGFSFGVRLYDQTAWSREDAERITDLGNNLNAFFARRDYRDYYRREGVTLFANMIATDALTLRIEHRNDLLSSLETKESVWSVFERDEDWRPNPRLETGTQGSALPFEGRMVSYVGTIVYDSREEYTHRGWLVRAVLEFSGGGLGGDYDFDKYYLELRRPLRLSPTQTLDLTASWGTGVGEDYPSHKLFHLGGPGDLRGHDYKSFAGKNLLFGRAEYGVDLWPDPIIKTIFFLDSGSVWYSGDDAASEFRHDFGIGFKLDLPTLGEVRVDVARAATSEDSDIFVYFDVEY